MLLPSFVLCLPDLSGLFAYFNVRYCETNIATYLYYTQIFIQIVHSTWKRIPRILLSNIHFSKGKRRRPSFCLYTNGDCQLGIRKKKTLCLEPLFEAACNQFPSNSFQAKRGIQIYIHSHFIVTWLINSKTKNMWKPESLLNTCIE